MCGIKKPFISSQALEIIPGGGGRVSVQLSGQPQGTRAFSMAAWGGIPVKAGTPSGEWWGVAGGGGGDVGGCGWWQMAGGVPGPQARGWRVELGTWQLF